MKVVDNEGLIGLVKDLSDPYNIKVEYLDGKYLLYCIDPECSNYVPLFEYIGPMKQLLTDLVETIEFLRDVQQNAISEEKYDKTIAHETCLSHFQEIVDRYNNG